MNTSVPELGEFYHFSTNTVSPRERFSLWRAHHQQLDLRLADPSAEEAFEGEVVECWGPDNTLCGRSTSVDVSTHFGRPTTRHIILSNVDAGAVQLRQGHDGTVRVEASDRLTMLDTRQGVTTTAVGHFSHLYLTLPEQVVIQALGADPARWHQPVQPLPNTGLFPFALAQMKMLAKNWKKLNRQEAAAAVHSTTQLALTGLRQLTVEKLDPEDNSATHALYNAACQYIERHAVTHQTAAVEIASRLGCSRAHLYRVFSAHNTTIGDVVRKANLDKAKWMLTKGRPLAHIAWETGYADAASFGRAFKKHLGMAPGEYRARYCRPPKV